MDLQYCPLGLIHGSHCPVIHEDVRRKIGQANLTNPSKNEGWFARLCHPSMRIIGTMGMHGVHQNESCGYKIKCRTLVLVKSNDRMTLLHYSLDIQCAYNARDLYIACLEGATKYIFFINENFYG